ncbi:MAG: (d)CMP kinase [Brevinemataceae bacterium]
MIVTIDGPAGSGKSSVSQQVAEKLGMIKLDTGAMYRSAAYFFKINNLDLQDKNIKTFIDNMKIEFKNNRVFVNGIDATDHIRNSEIDLFTSQYVSQNPDVRERMAFLQREIVKGKNVIAEGRDMGSKIFPNAELKIYLDADPKIRAKRRFVQMEKQGMKPNFEELLKEVITRDKEDSSRVYNPLCIPEDAYIIDTGMLSQDDVVQKIVHLVQSNLDKIIL